MVDQCLGKYRRTLLAPTNNPVTRCPLHSDVTTIGPLRSALLVKRSDAALELMHLAGPFHLRTRISEFESQWLTGCCRFPPLWASSKEMQMLSNDPKRENVRPWQAFPSAHNSATIRRFQGASLKNLIQ
jgi:hypothetical protein